MHAPHCFVRSIGVYSFRHGCSTWSGGSFLRGLHDSPLLLAKHVAPTQLVHSSVRWHGVAVAPCDWGHCPPCLLSFLSRGWHSGSTSGGEILLFPVHCSSNIHSQFPLIRSMVIIFIKIYVKAFHSWVCLCSLFFVLFLFFSNRSQFSVSSDVGSVGV